MRRDRSLLERLPVEARLLLLAAGPRDADAEIAGLLRTRAVDWRALLVLADRERATGVLWRRLKPHLPPTLTAEEREPFERVALVADFTSSYLEQRLGETLATLNSCNIRGLLLKGSALAVSVYRSFAERPMGDIDVVVERERAEEAFEAVQQIGWRWDRTEFPRERYRGHHHFPPLFDARGMDVRLELHTGLFVEGSPFSWDSAQVFAEGREVQVGKGRGVIPSPEHLLLHTCIHYTWSHMMLFGAWRAFRDVMALSDAGIDWPRFLTLAARHRAESACFWTLRLSERLVGASFPAEVMERLGRSTSARWMSMTERHLAREMFPSPEQCPSQWLRRTLWETAIRPGPAGHGGARPWLLDDMAPENVDPDGKELGMLRAFRHVPRVGAWLRYVRSLAS